ncbi:MAG: chemotaxis protein CheA [Gammaproteobacteria bacterium]|nr:chemotaxis protein CheA [Gammaproteobacteria bacterium]
MSMQNIRKLFVIEGREMLEQMENALLQLEKNPSDLETLKEIFRTIHTIKGSAGVMSLEELPAFAHRMENVLEKVRAGEMALDRNLVRILLSCHDHLAALLDRVNELEEDEPEADAALQENGRKLSAQLQACLEGVAADSPPDKNGQTNSDRQENLQGPANDESHADEIPAELVPIQQNEADISAKEGGSNGRSQKNLNVDAEKLDHLINLAGELVIANAGINLMAKNLAENNLQEAVSTMSHLVEDIRNSVLGIRMVPIGGTFNRFQRLVHDIGHELEKDIDLVITGSETELDKSMVERINDPLMHLVRNAADHGIESAEARRAAGKPAKGTVGLNAYHDSGNIVIEVSDDGRGLNREKILAMAKQKGLVNPDMELSKREVEQLIFEPGLSTAGEITQLSGRGVGLDVVKRNISALNGTIEVNSTDGQGVVMQIFLPLTLAIIDGFLLSTENSTFVVPLDRVVECVEFTEDGQTGYINLRGQVLPLLHIRKLFALRDSYKAERQNVVVIQNGAQQVGLVVDNLLGELQAVIKPLGRVFEKLPGVSGATILGNGDVALILDVPTLTREYVNCH